MSFLLIEMYMFEKATCSSQPGLEVQLRACRGTWVAKYENVYEHVEEVISLILSIQQFIPGGGDGN